MTGTKEPTAAEEPISIWSRNWRIFRDASGIQDGGTRMDAGIAAVYEDGRLAGIAEAAKSNNATIAKARDFAVALSEQGDPWRMDYEDLANRAGAALLDLLDETATNKKDGTE